MPDLEAYKPYLEDPLTLSIASGALLLFVLGWCRIFARAGFHAGWGVAMLVPGVNLVLFGRLAFGPWPVRRDLRALHRLQKVTRRTDNARIRKAA